MATYTMAQYNAAPQHKKKMRWTFIEKTIDFSAVPHASVTTGGKVAAWAANDVIEVIGLRPKQILMGITLEVVKPTSTEVGAGHKVEIIASLIDNMVLATARTDGSAYAYGISPYVLQDLVGSEGMAEGLFCQPIEIPTAGTIDVRINAAFTTGIVKVVAYVLEEDRA